MRCKRIIQGICVANADQWRGEIDFVLIGISLYLHGNMYYSIVNFLIKRIFPSLEWNIKTHEKIIYLTFDDGPIPEVTPWVLQQLKGYDAKATFFCVGENVKKHPEIFAQVKSENHQLGHHTFSHLNGWKTKNESYFSDVEKGNAVCPSPLFRPPYGKLKRKQIQVLKKLYRIIMWDVLSYDFDKNCSPEKCFQNVLKHATNGSIIVFHDSLKAEQNLRYALPKVLDYFSKKGYRFEAIA